MVLLTVIGASLGAAQVVFNIWQTVLMHKERQARQVDRRRMTRDEARMKCDEDRLTQDEKRIWHDGVFDSDSS
jgi:hypothetical protein